MASNNNMPDDYKAIDSAPWTFCTDLCAGVAKRAAQAHAGRPPRWDDLYTHLTPWGKIGCRVYYVKHNICLGFGHYSHARHERTRDRIDHCPNPFIHINPYALKAQDISAQGVA